MNIRRSVLALVTAAAVALPVVGAEVAAAPAATAAELQCSAGVYGFTPKGKLLLRRVRNTTVVSHKSTSTPLSYRVTQLGFMWQDKAAGGYNTHLAAIAADGRPRALLIKDRDGSGTLQNSSRLMLNRNFEPRLFTNSGGTEVFALDNLNRLQRLQTYRDDSGRFVFDNSRVVLRRMGGLKTLSFYNRQRIDGVNTDILYATTKTGALKQIRIPVRRPGDARGITVKRSGFGAFNGLVLGLCDGDVSKAFVIGVNARDNLAKSFVLRRAGHPSAANLTLMGRMDRRYTWKLHATL